MKLVANRVSAIVIGLCAMALSMGCASLTSRPPAAGAVAGQPTSGTEMSKADRGVRELWTLQLPRELKGRIHETGIITGAQPVVLATTPEQVLRITGQVAPVVQLKQHGRTGERAILPSPTIVTGPPDTPIGIMLHDQHDVTGFRLVSLDGTTRVELTDPRHFHYRLPPDGRSFVGIDVQGQHTALSADSATYRLFDVRGSLIGEIASAHPGTQDSSYTPDGTHLLVNSRRDGLSSYNALSAARVWNVPTAVKFFAPANGSVGRVLVSDAERRQVAALYEAGRQRWAVNLRQFGVEENVRNVALSPGGRIAAVSSRTLLLIMGAETGELMGRYQAGAHAAINSISASNNGLIVVGVQQARVKEGESSSGAVVVLDKTGKVVFQQQTVQQRSNAWTPTVQLDASGRFLLIRTLDAMSLLVME